MHSFNLRHYFDLTDIIDLMKHFDSINTKTQESRVGFSLLFHHSVSTAHVV